MANTLITGGIMSKIVLAIVATIAGLGLVVGLIVGTVYLIGGGQSHHTAVTAQPQPHININNNQQATTAQPPPTHYVPVPDSSSHSPSRLTRGVWQSAYTSDINERRLRRRLEHAQPVGPGRMER